MAGISDITNSNEPSALSFWGIVSAVPDFVLAGTFLLTWIAPARFGDHGIVRLVGVLALEFVIIHSSAFMLHTIVNTESRAKKIVMTLGFSVFYSFLAGGYAWMLHQWWPLYGFWGLTLKRILYLVLNPRPSGQEKNDIHRGVVASILFYLGFCFLTPFLPLPRLGFTPEALDTQIDPNGGVWSDDMYRVLAFGFFYFTALAISGCWGHRWIKLNTR